MNDRIFYLEFDESEEIMKMQQYYKSYEELLRDIVCVNDEVNIADRLVYLNYVYIILKFRNIRSTKKRKSKFN